MAAGFDNFYMQLMKRMLNMQSVETVLDGWWTEDGLQSKDHGNVQNSKHYRRYQRAAHLILGMALVLLSRIPYANQQAWSHVRPHTSLLNALGPWQQP